MGFVLRLSCNFRKIIIYYSLGSQTDDFERLEYEPSQTELFSPTKSDRSTFPLDDIVRQLEETESLHAQADLLHYLHSTV
jgi:hypothetical protein